MTRAATRRASRHDACAWCRGPLEGVRADARFCGQRCRQAAHRFGRACVVRQRATEPLRIGYADPPYPGLSRRYYEGHPDYRGEVDVRAELSRLQAFDGWALSTSAKALPRVLALAAELGLAPSVGAWFRGARGRGRSYRARQAWEPVIYSPARLYDPADASTQAPDDALIHVARPRTTDPARVIGAKPARFCFWLFDLLGARPGDEFTDLYPGSGGVARAWSVYVSRAGEGDASATPRGDASARARRDGFGDEAAE